MPNPDPEIPATASLTEAVSALLDGKTASPQAEWDAYLRKTEIWPSLDRWGFGPRFRQLLTLSGPQAKTLVAVQKKMQRVGAIVALVGQRGTGKTSIAARLAYEQAMTNASESRRLTEGPREISSVIYRKATDLLSRYKPLYGDFGSIDIEALTESRRFLCQEQEFLIIDELHECEESKFKNRVLADILDRRYAAKRDTILIANQTPDEFQKSTADSIISRLSEHGCIIPCNWDSFRKPL